MVAVAQLVEHWLVVPDAAGSNPVSHPLYFLAWSRVRALETARREKGYLNKDCLENDRMSTLIRGRSSTGRAMDS